MIRCIQCRYHMVITTCRMQHSVKCRNVNVLSRNKQNLWLRLHHRISVERIILFTSISRCLHPHSQVFHSAAIRLGVNLCAEYKTVAPPVQMNTVRCRQDASVVKFYDRLRIIVALHQHINRIFITGMQIRGQTHIINISIRTLFILIEQSQKLHSAHGKRLSHTFNLSSGLFSVREYHQSFAVLSRNQCQRFGNGIFEICCRFFRQRQQSSVIFFLRQKLFCQRILAECHNTVDITGRHLRDCRLQIPIRFFNVMFIAVRKIHYKNSGNPVAAQMNLKPQKR